MTATAVLFDETLVGDGTYRGVAVHDRSMTEDRTGAGYEAHALAVRGRIASTGTVDLRNGDVRVGLQVQGQVSLVGAAGRAQVGSTESLAGAGFVEAKASVSARGDIGGGLAFDPSRGRLGARVGAEAFAGAEVRA